MLSFVCKISVSNSIYCFLVLHVMYFFNAICCCTSYDFPCLVTSNCTAQLWATIQHILYVNPHALWCLSKHNSLHINFYVTSVDNKALFKHLKRDRLVC